VGTMASIVVDATENAQPAFEIDLTKLQPCGEDLYWHGCYNTFRDWRKYVTAESFAHPAKMAPGLCDRIFKHLKKLELLKEDSVICDFMAGIGTTNIMASLHGYRSISVELEPHFIEMGKGNRERLKRLTGESNGWEVIQGDARELTSLLKDKGYVGVVSPPYCKEEHSRTQKQERVKELFEGRSYIEGKEYSSNPSNIGNLKDKPLVGVISPPFADTIGNYTHERGDLQKYYDRQRKYNEKVNGAMGIKRPEPLQYSTNPNNIGNLPDKALVGVISPPYSETIARVGGEGAATLKRVGISTKTSRCYSDNPNNIGNLQDGSLVGITSPPYEEAMGVKHTDCASSAKLYEEKHWNTKYSTNKDNIGAVGGETYLEAMLKVYHEAFLSGISPLVTVTKNPTRGGELRHLDIDTAKLLMIAGYEIVDYHRAILFEERRQLTLTGEVKKEPKGRLSFFKRLSYQKGNVVARWEDIIIATRQA